MFAYLHIQQTQSNISSHLETYFWPLYTYTLYFIVYLLHARGRNLSLAYMCVQKCAIKKEYIKNTTYHIQTGHIKLSYIKITIEAALKEVQGTGC